MLLSPHHSRFRTLVPTILLAAWTLASGVLWAKSGTSGNAGGEPIRLLTDFALSPDGSRLAFAWAGEIWTVATTGGDASQLTRNEADDRAPRFSPDGSELAFCSKRWGGAAYQIYTMPTTGGAPVQHTRHSEGYVLEEYSRDGRSFVAHANRDHFWRDGARTFDVARESTRADRLLFDAAGRGARVSPDGNKILFSREGTSWFRKGYQGSQASQIWLYDRVAKSFECVLKDEFGYRYPEWLADASGFYYVGQQSGSFNLWRYRFADASREQLTFFDDDSVFWPTVSRDGSTIVFRHRFDLYRLDTLAGGAPQRIDIVNAGEPLRKDIVRDVVKSATSVAFTKDALEIAFIAGGDLWVMDTELREPKRVTSSAADESEPLFTADGNGILFLSDQGGQRDIWLASRGDETAYWWQNERFHLRKLTDDGDTERMLNRVAQGRIAYVRGAGDLFIMDEDGRNTEQVLASWNAPDFDFSPDGKWLAYAVDDGDYNRDVWIKPVDGSREPFNVSTHPDNDRGPHWSPDGRVLAFTGRRQNDESDIYYVFLRESEEEQSSRDRQLDKALEKMKKRKPKRPANAQAASADGRPEAKPKSDVAKADKATPKKGAGKSVTIDFAGLRDRIHRIAFEGTERSLFFVGDRQLAFSAWVGHASALYTVEIPTGTPKSLSKARARGFEYLPDVKSIATLVSGKPTLLTLAGKATSYAFSGQRDYDRGNHYRAAFVQAWAAMRDRFYDEAMNNRNWDAIRRKYEDLAAGSIDDVEFAHVIQLMLGELNASHLGFYAGSRDRSKEPWTDITAHLGVRYDAEYNGPGWKVAHVFKDGPAAELDSKLEVGDVILSIDGVGVDPSICETTVLNGPLERDIELRVHNAAGDERRVRMRPTSYGQIRRQLYDEWLDHNRRLVAQLSGDRLGYLHIRGMNWSSFLKFETELFKVGSGKDGLIIDVRENGGGSTTDHLLTVLCQPQHAITRSRRGEPGYPQDRLVYASWHKPIIVLCNQNSFSNAEIFAHAIKTLGRGKLVGAPTAGGVISTGSARIMDIGSLRMPTRGWYLLNDGEDMELNGAIPDYVLWPNAGEIPAGKDVQLERAIEVLADDVAKWKAKARPRLRKASERRREGEIQGASYRF